MMPELNTAAHCDSLLHSDTIQVLALTSAVAQLSVENKTILVRDKKKRHVQSACKFVFLIEGTSPFQMFSVASFTAGCLK